MDKSDLILAAIEQLGRNLDAKIEGVRAELSGAIAQVNAGLTRLETEVKTETA